jgi:hypothetical protein
MVQPVFNPFLVKFLPVFNPFLVKFLHVFNLGF